MASPIRVLHVIDKFTMDGVNPSSCSRLFAEWIPRHDDQQFQVEVAGLRPRDAAGKYLEEHDIRVHYIDEGKYSPANIGAIARLASAGKYDLLHLHGYSSANFGRLAAKRAGIRSIVHEHAVLKVLPHQYVIDWLLRGKNDVAIAVSSAVKDFMMHGRSVPEDCIRVIWNGIRLDAFQQVDAAAVAAFKSKMNLPERAIALGTVTRLREEKGNEDLIRAMARLAPTHPDLHLILIGDGPDLDKLTQLAAGLDIAERVHFVGFVSDIPPALAAMDMVAIPSLREGFGLALLEAMAAGKPVVATGVGGMLELAEDGVSARFVPPSNPEALAKALAEVLDSQALQQELATQAQERSKAFSIERNVDALEDCYRALAGAA